MEIVSLAGGLDKIRTQRQMLPPERAMLVALSGIDGSGKGYLSEKIVEQLQQQSLKVANINVDGWLHLPHQRFNQERPGEHFYEEGIRFQEMFEGLVLPLKYNRSWRLEADLADPTNGNTYYKYLYNFEDVDVIVLEGVFLLKQAFLGYYDLTIWIDCSFETALDRALLRSQEGLSIEQTIKDYHQIYFAAQKVHFAHDYPQEVANLVIQNDQKNDACP